MQPGTDPSQTGVLLVEDNYDQRKLYKTFLELSGYAVIAEAETGPRMLELALKIRPSIIVFDIHLPGYDGLTAFERIQEHFVVPGVVMTADRDEATLHRAMQEYVLGFVVKPISDPIVFSSAIRMAQRNYGEFVQLTTENKTLRQTLEERKIIERAKGLVQRRYRCSERQAFQIIQRSSQLRSTADHPVTMAMLAQSVIQGDYSQLCQS